LKSQNIIRKLSLLFSATILTVATTFGQQRVGYHDFVEISERTSTSVVIAIKPFNVKLQRANIDGKNYHRVEIPGYGLSTIPGEPMLPQSGILLEIPPEAQVSTTVLESVYDESAEIHVLPAPEIIEVPQTDQISYRYLENLALYESDNYWPRNLVEAAGTGKIRGRKVARIQINPIQYNPAQNSLRIYTTLKIKINFGGTAQSRGNRRTHSGDRFDRIANSLILNSTPGLKTPPQIKFSSNWYNSQNEYYKLFVSQEGIYVITYGELVNAGVAVDQNDLQSLKILNRGEEIPIWIEGPAETTFGPENTIYFYGDRHRSSESYYGFFTDTNVYWLTYEGGPGKRYDLVSDIGAPAVSVGYYWESAHIEQDNEFHRANTTSEIEPEEGWIWRFFFDDEREVIELKLRGIFEEVSICTLRVRLYGTTLDPVSPDHHVRFSINEQVIDDVFFDERMELIRTIAFPTTLLREGNNKVEIHLVPDTGAEINQIYLDWIELIYPRVHAAGEDNLKFTYENSGQSPEFSLVNFKNEDIFVFDPAGSKLWKPTPARKSFYSVASAAFDDGSFVDFEWDFQTYETKQRGHNLVVINSETEEVEIKNYDTFSSSDASNEMAAFINSLPQNSVVLAGIADEGTINLTETAHLAFESLGSAHTRQIGLRDSWSIIAWKGAAIGSVPELLSKRFQGPSAVSDTLSGEKAFRFGASFKDTTENSYTDFFKDSAEL